MAGKTKLSSILDMASSGMLITTTMELEKKTVLSLRRAFEALIEETEGGSANEGRVGLVTITRENGIKGNVGPATYWVTFPLVHVAEDVSSETDTGVGKDTYTLAYDFKVSGSNRFLNVSCNPTRLIRGKNGIPVLIKGMNPLETFSYMLRMPYLILEDILSLPGFKWTGVDKKKLDAGEIALQMLQVAFYSGDLKSRRQRDEVMKLLRISYGGLDSTAEGKATSICESVGLEFSSFSNHDGNFRLVAKTKGHRVISMTAYCKDDSVSVVDTDKSRVDTLIRFDCTLYARFLYGQKINTVKDLEKKYKEKCDEGGYDIGFTRWLSGEVFSRILLSDILDMDRKRYYEGIRYLDEELATGKTSKLLGVYKEWKANSQPGHLSISATAGKLGIPRRAVYQACKTLREDYDIRVNLNESFVDALFVNRAMAYLSQEERRAYASMLHENPNDLNMRTFFEVHERAEEANAIARKTLLEDGKGILRIRKFSVPQIKMQNFYIRKVLMGG